MTVRDLTIALLLSLALANACAPNESGESAPPTLEERCNILCTPTEGRPCSGRDVEPGCVDACLARLEPLAEDCQRCVERNSGWQAAVCDCDEDDLLGEVWCEDCHYTSGGRNSCSGSTPGNSCDHDSSSCEGFELFDDTYPACSELCAR